MYHVTLDSSILGSGSGPRHILSKSFLKNNIKGKY